MISIESLTIVSQQGVHAYIVGNEYNGLRLHEIQDMTASSEHFHVTHFIGLTETKEPVFEAINVPMDIEYKRDYKRDCDE